MTHTNNLISFLRHYGPIPASDNMYDELVQSAIQQHNISDPIAIPPARLTEIQENFKASKPRNIILTGTAGDGKTYHCRLIWKYLGGSEEQWQKGKSIVSLELPEVGKTLSIVKDLSELRQQEKDDLLPRLAEAVSSQQDSPSVFLVAANDGQLLATWQSWADVQSDASHQAVFKTIENMLVENQVQDSSLNLDLYNLSLLNASKHFDQFVEQIVEHKQWSQCHRCELMDKDDGEAICPIRINRERLKEATFRERLAELLDLARTHRTLLPIRDLLLLCVNIILGDRQNGTILLNCQTAKDRAKDNDYQFTNPYANVFGANLPERQRRQYQVFTTLESFGIGRETNNQVDHLLIYGPYELSKLYEEYINNDPYYGKRAYNDSLKDYLEGERQDVDKFMQNLADQRRRLFFSMPTGANSFDPWKLTVYRSSRMFLDFIAALNDGQDIDQTVTMFAKGLNRIFCGMMIDDSDDLYFSSSGGDGRGQIASWLDFELPMSTSPKPLTRCRVPYARFGIGDHTIPIPRLFIVDPNPEEKNGEKIIESIELPLTHFEYVIQVANGSLPASFSRQCHEDFLNLKLRVIKSLRSALVEDQFSTTIRIKALTVDESGRVQDDNIRVKT